MPPLKLTASLAPLLPLLEPSLIEPSIPQLRSSDDASLPDPTVHKHSMLQHYMAYFFIGLLIAVCITYALIRLFYRPLRGIGPGELPGNSAWGKVKRLKRGLRTLAIGATDVYQRNVTGVPIEGEDEARIDWRFNPLVASPEHFYHSDRISPRKKATGPLKNITFAAPYQGSGYAIRKPARESQRPETPSSENHQYTDLSEETPLLGQNRTNSIYVAKSSSRKPLVIDSDEQTITSEQQRANSIHIPKSSSRKQLVIDSDEQTSPSDHKRANSIHIPKSSSRKHLVKDLEEQTPSPSHNRLSSILTPSPDNRANSIHLPKRQSKQVVPNNANENTPLLSSSSFTSSPSGSTMADRSTTNGGSPTKPRKQRLPDRYELSEEAKEELKKVTHGKKWDTSKPLTGLFKTRGYMNEDMTPHVWQSRRIGEAPRPKSPAFGPDPSEYTTTATGPSDLSTVTSPIDKPEPSDAHLGSEQPQETKPAEPVAEPSDTHLGSDPFQEEKPAEPVAAPSDAHLDSRPSQEAKPAEPVIPPWRLNPAPNNSPPPAGYTGPLRSKVDHRGRPRVNNRYTRNLEGSMYGITAEQLAERMPRTWYRTYQEPVDQLARARAGPRRNQGSPTRSQASPTRSRASPTRKQASPIRKQGSPTRAQANPGRTKAAQSSRPGQDYKGQSTQGASPVKDIDVKGKEKELVQSPSEDDYFSRIRARFDHGGSERPSNNDRQTLATPLTTAAASGSTSIPRTPTRIPVMKSPTFDYPVRGFSYTTDPVPKFALAKARGSSTPAAISNSPSKMSPNKMGGESGAIPNSPSKMSSSKMSGDESGGKNGGKDDGKDGGKDGGKGGEISGSS